MVHVLPLRVFGWSNRLKHAHSLLSHPPGYYSPPHTKTRWQTESRSMFYHAAMFSRLLSTWCAAIDARYLNTWQNFTSTQVRCHPPFLIRRSKGILSSNGRISAPPRKPCPATSRRIPNRLPTSPTLPIPACKPPCCTSLLPSACTISLLMNASLSLAKLLAIFLAVSLLLPASGDNSYLLVVIEDNNSNYIHTEPLHSLSVPSKLTGYT